MCLFSKCNGLFFFLFLWMLLGWKSAPPPPPSSSVVFWSKVQWWCNTAFSSHLLSLPKNPCPKAISRHFNWESNYGISVPSLFSFSPPLVAQMSLQRRRPSNEFWSAAFLPQNVSDDWILLWCCDFCKTVVLGLWTVVDNTGWNHACVTTYRNYWMSGRKVGLRWWAIRNRVLNATRCIVTWVYVSSRFSVF